MLIVSKTLVGCSIKAADGDIGSIVDLLFDQATWGMRWMVVKTGGWLLGHAVLIHPSAIMRAEVAGRANGGGSVTVRLTKAEVKGSLDASQDEPVSQQLEGHLYASPGCDPLWGGTGYFGMYSGDAARDALGRRPDQGDPNLRSTSAVIGYEVFATDGAIGHVEEFLLDDRTWAIDSIVVNLKNWGVGQPVLLSPHTVTGIGWSDQQVRINASRDQVKRSPPWMAGVPLVN